MVEVGSTGTSTHCIPLLCFPSRHGRGNLFYVAVAVYGQVTLPAHRSGSAGCTPGKKDLQDCHTEEPAYAKKNAGREK